MKGKYLLFKIQVKTMISANTYLIQNFLWLSSQNMWVFDHPLAMIRSDSAMKRSLGPRKVKLTQGRYWVPKVISSEPTCLFQVESLPINPSEQSKVFQIATPSVTCICSKSQRHMGPATRDNPCGRTMWRVGCILKKMFNSCQIFTFFMLL